MPVSGHQFALVRLALGAYLTVHFAHLAPYAPEVFSKAGMLPDPSLLPTYGVLPNPLFSWDAPALVTGLVVLLALLSVPFMLGVYRRPLALLLWLGWAMLFGRNPLIANPSIPYVGWLLLACAVIPEGEPWALRPFRPARDWQLPPILYWGGLALLMVGYSVSGLHKLLEAPSWRDGSAFAHVLTIPLARDTVLRELMLELPRGALQLLTYAALAVEIAAAPLALWPRTRPLAWAATVALQLGIFSMVAFADLTVGMLLMHAFVFDRRWVAGRKLAGETVVFFDGVCGLCNRSVDFILSEDAAERLRFAPLQGEAAARELGPQPDGAPRSIILREGGVTYTRSEAVLRIAGALGGAWRLLALLCRVVPRLVRDAAYDFIAAHRYQWFGKREACRLPTPAERRRFLA